MKTQIKKQQCNVAGLALGWIGYVAGLGYFAFQRQWVVASLWFAGVPTLRWALYHFFPRIAHVLGYGQLTDTLASRPASAVSLRSSPVTVRVYTFFSCPFCPIVLARLRALRNQIEFRLEVIDCTLAPQTLIAKGIKSVPVVEVGDERLVGNSTTAQLAELISRCAAPELRAAS